LSSGARFETSFALMVNGDSLLGHGGRRRRKSSCLRCLVFVYSCLCHLVFRLCLRLRLRLALGRGLRLVLSCLRLVSIPR
jgi:hypothetical protein